MYFAPSWILLGFQLSCNYKTLAALAVMAIAALVATAIAFTDVTYWVVNGPRR